MNGQLDIGGVTPSRYFFSIAVILGLLCAMTSGEQNRHWLAVTLQWQLQAIVPMALLIGAHSLLLLNARFANLNAWLALAISGILGASLFAPFALLVEGWLDPASTETFALIELADEWLAVTPPVVVCWLALNAPWVLGFRVHRVGAQADETEGREEPADLPEFIGLLPRADQGAPLLLKSELHYLQVVTDRGRGLILYNLSDAVSALPLQAGLMVHRSYWVAFDAIEEFRRQGRQGELVLKNGERVPVSRARLASVAEALEANQP